MKISPIAHIHTDFTEKFGLPRQSGMVPALLGKIVFTAPYRSEEALRGLSGFSHIWLIWQFSESVEKMEAEGWQPTVRPPRLGGNTRMGVFATRSPFRPNNLGLSAVKLEEVGKDGNGPYLVVSGVDMKDGTPIYDIKPYVPHSDCITDAAGGFTEEILKPENDYRLDVVLPEEIAAQFSPREREALTGVLRLDPRPSYQKDGREYGLTFAGKNVRFRVEGKTARVTAAEDRKE